MTKFGVGFSDLSNSFEAGKSAALQALLHVGVESYAINLCLLFCTSRHEAEEFFMGVKSELGSCKYVGGFANGTITNNSFGYDGYQCAVAIMTSTTVNTHYFVQEDIAFNEYETGKKLFEQFAETSFETDPQVLLFFDAVNREKGRFQMNYGTPLLQGAKEVLAGWPTIAGARLMGDMKFKPTRQWFEDGMTQNAAILLALTGNIKMDVLRLDGCTPASAYHTVTKCEGATITEIDNKPAIDFVSEMLGAEVQGDYESMKFFVTLGRNLSDKWDRKNAEYVNRMCVGVNPKNNGLIMAEMDLVVGSEFQLMRRGYVLDMIEEKVAFFVQNRRKEGKNPLFALYLNCAGRAAAYSQTEEEDAMYIQNAVNGEFPLLGIYEAGELAMVKDDFQVFDWTGVFCLFSEKI
ncbi:FIST N-terminal domain-containing protein [Leeuwenhoekiella sp. A16]|uniref:FIST N-terminal domain-containing protein n=1 Tax=unclassified Leeuwenhoekiella TaxID=2615029 RepID=UPI003A7FFA46